MIVGHFAEAVNATCNVYIFQRNSKLLYPRGGSFLEPILFNSDGVPSGGNSRYFEPILPIMREIPALQAFIYPPTIQMSAAIPNIQNVN